MTIDEIKAKIGYKCSPAKDDNIYTLKKELEETFERKYVAICSDSLYTKIMFVELVEIQDDCKEKYITLKGPSVSYMAGNYPKKIINFDNQDTIRTNENEKNDLIPISKELAKLRIESLQKLELCTMFHDDYLKGEITL